MGKSGKGYQENQKQKKEKGKKLQKDSSKEKEQKPEIQKKKQETVQNKIIEKKKVAVSFKRLNKIFKEEDVKKMTLMDLKKAASTFDVNPAVNYKLLSLLKQKEKSTYDKFITKYKYTLDYRDAKSLNCLNEDENKIILESKRYFNEDIKEINSLSKMKLFNLLFRLFDFKITDEPYFKCAIEIKDVLNSYAINETLIFKILNNYGNYELQYYTYLRLFIIYFLNLLEPIFKQNKENKDSNIIDSKEDNTIEIEEDNTIEIEEEDIFFDWVENSDGETELVDLTEIEIRKNALNKFIEENIEKNKNIINMDIEKGENNNDKKDKEKNASEKKNS